MTWYGRDHVAVNMRIEKDDFELAPFNREGGFLTRNQVNLLWLWWWLIHLPNVGIGS